ncbi:hypothetical protein [Moraxella nasovis]|nr:hypothetical protein [Moraxella nasovis]
MGDNNTNYANRYYGETTAQIEKLELIIAQKDKEIASLRQLLDK